VSEEKSWVKIIEQTDKYGRFEASPLRRGFGNTLGNSLRRVLLASLGGMATTAVKIDGVSHEFATMDNLKEDILDIIMNLKGVVYSYSGSDTEPRKAKLSVKEDGTVTAGDIKTDSDVKVINKDHYIATLNKGGKLNVEITLNQGVGYLPVDPAQKKDMPIGTVPVDATFSPVLKVNHTVEDFRVGKKIDFDKLILEVWTNGCITPVDAVAKSAMILQEELAIFIDMNKKPEKKSDSKAIDLDAQRQLGLKLTIEDLELSARSYNCLRKAGIEKIAELVSKDLPDLMKIKNFGRKSADEINSKLKQFNLALKELPEEDEDDE
jgi:DNA-directed RNA polymerase subunit alpha